MQYTDMSWANLDDEIGYVMLQAKDVEIGRDVRYKNTFFTMSINHGENPVDEDYAYVILPNTTSQDTENYANNPDIEVLCLDNRMHAIYDVATGIIGVNAFEPSSICGLNILTPCSIMFTYNNGIYNMYVADPTLTLNTIKIEFDKDVLIDGADNITIDGKIVSIYMVKHGASYSFTAIEQ